MQVYTYSACQKRLQSPTITAAIARQQEWIGLHFAVQFPEATLLTELAGPWPMTRSLTELYASAAGRI